jgi:hypothetical protein
LALFSPGAPKTNSLVRDTSSFLKKKQGPQETKQFIKKKHAP